MDCIAGGRFLGEFDLHLRPTAGRVRYFGSGTPAEKRSRAAATGDILSQPEQQTGFTASHQLKAQGGFQCLTFVQESCWCFAA